MEDKKRILKWSHLFHSDEEDVFLYYTEDGVDTFRVGRGDGNKLKFSKVDNESNKKETSYYQVFEHFWLFNLNLADKTDAPGKYDIDVDF